MAIRTITRIFDSESEAHEAVRALEAAGFAHPDLTYMGGARPMAANEEERGGATGAGTGAATGTALGTMLGGGAGLLAGLGALAIPGLGPVVAAGWLVSTLVGAGAGAAVGGVAGALMQSGMGEEQAEMHAEALRRGGHLVALRIEEERAAEAESILDRHAPADMAGRAEEYRKSGWTGAGPGGSEASGSEANDPATKRGTYGRGTVA
jgi:hypothetical protein